MEEAEKTYRPFTEARLFVKRLKLQSEVEWYKYTKDIDRKFRKKPPDIPSDPDIIYKDSGWVDFSDWLGFEYLDFASAISYARKLNLKSKEEWIDSYFEFLPYNLPIPLEPNKYYKDKGWVDWDHWLAGSDCVKSAGDIKLNLSFKAEWLVDQQPEIKLNSSLEYKNFNKAREFIKQVGLSSIVEWELFIAGALTNKGVKPKDIPAEPNEVYKHKGWRGWFYWLGNEMISFEEARKFAHRLNFKHRSEWFDYTMGANKFNLPLNYDIPDDPELYYKDDGWVSWNDWLGVKIKIKQNGVEFEKAKELARQLGFKNSIEWTQNIKENKTREPLKYKSLPIRPDIAYKYNGWVSWNDWLGVVPLVKWRNFIEAREFARSLKLNGKEEWMNYVRGRTQIPVPLPVDIPKDPSQRYKNTGWVGWKDWVQTQGKNYDEAKKFVHRLGIKNSSEWAKYRKGELLDKEPLPNDIPPTPNDFYKNNGWKGWSDWLGDSYQQKGSNKFRSYEEAKKFVRNLGIKTSSEWSLYAIGKYKNIIPLPDDIPRNPKNTYTNKGWIDWRDWLGESFQGRSEKMYKDYNDAREFTRKLQLKNSVEWSLYVRGKLKNKGTIPEDIPKYPSVVYHNNGWESWADWLGESYTINEKLKIIFRKL